MDRDKLLKRSNSNTNLTPRSKPKSSQYIKLLINKIVNLENRLKDDEQLIDILNNKIAELQNIINELEFTQNIEIVKKLSDLEFKYDEIKTRDINSDDNIATQQLLDLCRDQLQYNNELFNENEKLRDEKIEIIDKKIDEKIDRNLDKKISHLELEINKQPDDSTIDFKILEKISEIEAKNDIINEKLDTINENKISVPPLDLPKKMTRRSSTTSNITRPSPVRQNVMKRTKSQSNVSAARKSTTSFKDQYKKRIDEQRHPTTKKHNYLKRKS